MDSVTQDNQSLAEQITKVVENDEVQLPPLPELVMRIRELLANDTADARKIARIVNTDPAVAASLLRISNSAAFGGLQPVTDVKQAVARLGLNQVASIVTALSMKGHFVSETKERKLLLQTLWDHSVSTAFAAQRLAEKINVDPETAFLAGLLHDSGQLLVAKAIDVLEAKGVTPPTTTVQDELMEVLHCELGYQVLKDWNLAEPVPLAALNHENPPDDSDDGVLLCVQAGDVISQKAGFHLDPDPDIDLLQEPAIDNLAISDIELAELMIDIEDELNEAHKLFR